MRRCLIPAVLVALLCWLAAPALAAEPQRPGRQHLVYNEGTPDELNVYRVLGAKDGKTLMLIGGIQGDEPGGFLSADLYADIALAKGNLIVVPRANFYSIILRHRGPDGDMNRQFGDPVTAKRHAKIIAVLKMLIAESDMLLNLHDGSGFFRTRWEGPMANPRRYGQSLIADAAVYETPEGRTLDLKGMAERVLARVNPLIEDPRHHLAFNNHRTAEKDTIHKEQRLSATYYALTRCHIPAFGVETSKSLPNQAMMVRHHNLVINGFMEELGIEPESPATYLEEPRLQYLVISVNERIPVVVDSRSELAVHPGDQVRVLHIEANYDRGLNCDIEGLGSVNDLRQAFAINRPTRVVVRKDGQKIGQVRLVLQAEDAPTGPRLRAPVLYFLVEADGRRLMVADQETLTLVKGDRLKIVEVLSNLPDQSEMQVNFKGFVPKTPGPNDGEDRGFSIDTAHDLMERYSSCRSPGGGGSECYQVLATRGREQIGVMTVRVVPGRLEYLVLKRDDGPKMVYHHGETIRAEARERLTVVDVKSNVTPERDLSLALDGPEGRKPLAGDTIDIADQSLAPWLGRSDGKVRLVVLRQDQAIGHVRLSIGGR